MAAMKKNTDIMDKFLQQSLSQIKNIGDEDNNDLITVSAKDSIRLAVRRMGHNQVLSLPVIGEEGAIGGFVDLLDVVQFITSLVKPTEVDPDDLKSLKMRGRDIGNAEVSTIMNLSDENPYIPATSHSMVTSVLPYFSLDVHRTVLLDENQTPVTVISQTDVAKSLKAFLDENSDALKERANKDIRDLGYEVSKVVSVNHEQTVLEALHVIVTTKTRCLAVVHKETGQLVGNFSANDVRGLYDEYLPRLTQPVTTFLGKHNNQSLSPPIVQEGAKFMDVLNKLVSLHVKWLWMVDDDNKPLATVGLTDVIQMIAKL